MKLKKLILLISILLYFFNSFLLAQNSSLIGKVIDKSSRKPIKDVNIYIANTLIGTTTNENGYFELSKLPYGTFTLVLSHVSYYFIKKEIKLKSKFNDIGTINFSLKAHELETVLVTEDTDDNWKDQFALFRKKFIGEGVNSDSTYILNPYKIDFHEIDDKLIASTIEPIEIVNKSLGYKIEYFLDYFEGTDDYTKYSGNAVFSDLNKEDLTKLDQWKTNREKTYNSSFRHFIETLDNCSENFNDNIEDFINFSSFDSIMVEEIMNYIYWGDGLDLFANVRYTIDSLIIESDDCLNSEGFFIFWVADLPWNVPKPFSELPISIVNILQQGDIETERFLSFDDYLRVYYIPGYKEDPFLINYNIKYITVAEESYLTLEEDSVMVDYRGRYCDKFGIHNFGKFGQERVSDMLPYEYNLREK